MDVYRHNTSVARGQYTAFYDLLGRAKKPAARRRVMSVLYRVAENLIRQGGVTDPLRDIDMLNADPGDKAVPISIYIPRDTYPVLYSYAREQPKRKASVAVIELLNAAAEAYANDAGIVVAKLAQRTTIEVMVEQAQRAGTVEHIDLDQSTRDEDNLTRALDVWSNPDAWATGTDPGNIS